MSKTLRYRKTAEGDGIYEIDFDNRIRVCDAYDYGMSRDEVDAILDAQEAQLRRDGFKNLECSEKGYWTAER